MLSRHLRSVRLRLIAFLATLAAIACGSPPQTAVAQQEPVAVAAVSGIDRLLDDVDFLFEAGEAPQFAQFVRGVIANFNELRGLDRERPVGAYLFFPAGGETDPQPLLFFPVSDVEELLTSVRIGAALHLERAEGDNRLTLHTDEGEIPIALQHGYAFLDPTKSGDRLSQPLPDPADLLGDALANRDAVLIVRREGIPPFLFEVALGQLRNEALKTEPQKDGEDDTEYAIRHSVEESLYSLMEATVQDWRRATIGLRVSADDRTARFDANIEMDPDGQTATFLDGISNDQTQFATQLAETSAFSLSLNWQPTQAGRDLLAKVVSAFREQMAGEVADADDESRAAVIGVIDALDATAAKGKFDTYFQLIGDPPNGFVLIGATAVEESAKVAAGIEKLLPYAAESKDIRSIEMNVARAGDVAIHRMWPQSLRKQDQRLYGDDAAIYLAAGQDAIWMAIGGDGTADLLADSIQSAPGDRPTDVARPGVLASPARMRSNGPALLNLTVHASDWVGFARTDTGGQRSKIAKIARQAFNNPDEDTFTLKLQRTDNGLGLDLHLDYGYVRLFGLAISKQLQKN